MMRALYTAATGMRAEQTNVDTIANNLSNVNTTGFKGQRTEFKSLLYQTIQTRSTSGNGDAKPVGAQVGLGTRVAATTSTYTQGPLNSTERPTDFALEGDGFFAVRGTDNQTYYTRNGAFTWSQYGNGQCNESGCLSQIGKGVVIGISHTSQSRYAGNTDSRNYKQFNQEKDDRCNDKHNNNKYIHRHYFLRYCISSLRTRVDNVSN